MQPAVLWLSVVACLALLIAQVGAYLEFAMVPAPTASTTGPQSTADLVFGLMAIVGGIFSRLQPEWSALSWLPLSDATRGSWRSVWRAPSRLAHWLRRLSSFSDCLEIRTTH